MSGRGDLLRVRARFEETQAKQEKRLDRFLALMGDGEGNVAVTGTPLFVYVRVQGRGVVECLNRVAPLRNDLPLVVGYDFKRPDTLQVLSIYEGGMTSFGPYAYLPAHHQAHEFRNANGGDDVVWIQKQAVLPLLCRPTSPTSMFVEVLEDNYPWLSGWNLFPTTTSADLTARIPAGAGDARFVLIYVDGATNILGYSNGAIFPAAWPPGTAFSLTPAPPAGSIPVAAIYLPNGITAIGWNNIYDLRLFNQPMGGSVTPSPHDLLGSVAHDDTVTSAPVQGSLVVANATPAWDDLLIGTAHQLLKVNAGGTDPAWASFDWDEISAAAAADMVHDHTSAAEGGLIVLGFPAVAGAGYALVSDGVNSWAVDQTPLWTGEHSFEAGIAFTGASGVNEITVPDNIAIALELLDAGGLEYMRIVSTDVNPYILFDPAAAGINVGIGIAAPTELLHAQGAGAAKAIKVETTTAHAAFFEAKDSAVQIRLQASVATGFVGVLSDHRLDLVGNNIITMTLKDGAAGIGTVTIPHGGVGAALLALDAPNASVNGPHVQFTTASDDYPLLQMLNFAHDNVALAFDAYYDGAWKSSDAGSNCRITKTADLLYFQYDSGVAQGGAIAWNVGIVHNLANGYVGVGVVPTFKFDVLDDRAGTFAVQIFNDGDNVNRYVLYLKGGADNGAAVGTTYYLYASDGDGDATGCLKTVDGVFQLADISDESRKDNIVDTKVNGLEIINELQVRDFTWKANPKAPVMTSFIAQEAQEVFPAMVGEGVDGTLMTSRAMLIPILTKAIQELDTRLTKLEAT